MLTHQNHDCVERVEQKMGMQLHLQCAQVCLCELTFEQRRAQLELRRQSFTFEELAIVAYAVLNADNQPINDHVQMEVDRHDSPEGCDEGSSEPGQAEERRDKREQNLFDQRETYAPHEVHSAAAPPVFSLDRQAARKPPDEWSEKSPSVCGCQPDHEIAAPRDRLALVKKTPRILAYEEQREQSPAAEISQPTD